MKLDQIVDNRMAKAWKSIIPFLNYRDKYNLFNTCKFFRYTLDLSSVSSCFYELLPTKMGNVFPMVVISMWNSGQMTIGKTHPTFDYVYAIMGPEVTYLAWSRRNRKNQFISNSER